MRFLTFNLPSSNHCAGVEAFVTLCFIQLPLHLLQELVVEELECARVLPAEPWEERSTNNLAVHAITVERETGHKTDWSFSVVASQKRVYARHKTRFKSSIGLGWPPRR